MVGSVALPGRMEHVFVQRCALIFRCPRRLPTTMGVLFTVYREHFICVAGVHTSLQVGSILIVPIVSNFQYDPSLYPLPIHGIMQSCIFGGGDCRMPQRSWDRCWGGPLHLLPLQRHSVLLPPITGFSHRLSLCTISA